MKLQWLLTPALLLAGSQAFPDDLPEFSISHSFSEPAGVSQVRVLRDGQVSEDFWVKRLVLANTSDLPGLSAEEQARGNGASGRLAAFMEEEVQRLKQQICTTLLASEGDNASLARELAQQYTDSDAMVATRIEQEYRDFISGLSQEGLAWVEHFIAEELQAYFAESGTDWFEASAADPGNFVHGAYNNCTFR